MTEKKKRGVPLAHTCGVPNEHCGGSITHTNNGLKVAGLVTKTHSQPEESFKCMCRYLVNVLGYKKLNARDYQDPITGYVRVLTKPSRYGSALRNGKQGTRNMVQAKFGCKGGMVASY